MRFIEIRTLSVKPKKIKIQKELYDAVLELLYALLAEENEISLQRLIQIGEERIDFYERADLPWAIVQIKNDLLFKQVLAVKIDDSRNQLVYLKDRQRSLKLGHLHTSFI
ncbi:MAG TPA: hypothetical protein VIT44_12840 [Cyclobacteriaceae bacterium]